MRAYRALGKMSPEQRAELRLQPWLYTITLNVTRNRLRSKRPSNVALDALADPDALLRESQRRAAAARNDRRAATPRSRWSSARCCSCRCTCAPPRRCASSKAAATRRSPRSFTSRSAPVKSHVHRAVRILRRILGPQIGRFTPEGAPLMRCRDVEAMWDEIRGECRASLKETVQTHLHACPSVPSDSTNSTKASRTASRACRSPSRRATSRRRSSSTSQRSSAKTRDRRSCCAPSTRRSAGSTSASRSDRIAYVGLDTGEPVGATFARESNARLRRPVVLGDAPQWLARDARPVSSHLARRRREPSTSAT